MRVPRSSAGDGESAPSLEVGFDGEGFGGGVRRLKTPEISALEVLSRAPQRTGLFSDFDGTIAPLVTDPEASRALPGALSALHDLSRKMAVVAAVSGRSAGFLAEGLELARHRSRLRGIGLHGLEEWCPDGSVKLRAGVSAWRPTIETVRVRLLETVPDGVSVEDKGYGITVHWRSLGASGAELQSIAARSREVVETIGAEFGLLSRLGKASVELVLPLGIDKGSVVTELCEGLEIAGYLGDDLGDLLAFQALDRLWTTSGLIAMKIAVAGDEVPRELIEAADLVLEGPHAAARFLEALDERLGPS